MSQLEAKVTPIIGGGAPQVGFNAFPVAALGYEEAEYTLTGTASAYARTGDGVTVVEEADFATRILVYRPADPSAFNGTVWVEWFNVSAGADAGPDWIFTHTELARSGAAWVGVSAQAIGVQGGEGLVGMASPGLVGTDPERYGHLVHPGDRFSYDIYSHAGAAARRATGTILDGLAIERVLAIGESQSAFRLTTYANDIDPVARVFDGFLVHARGGTAHADVYILAVGAIDTGAVPIAELAQAWKPSDEFMGMHLDLPVNAGPQHYVMNAAVSHFDRWVRDGICPPPSPRMEVVDGAFATDEHGNVRGGIRTPHVDVPTAVLSGFGNGGSPIAFLSGSTTPFDVAKLAALYPSRDDYLARYAAATDAAVAAGFVLAADAAEITAIAGANCPF